MKSPRVCRTKALYVGVRNVDRSKRPPGHRRKGRSGYPEERKAGGAFRNHVDKVNEEYTSQ